ncbi:NAD(P)-dependent alcohol dehydrogenase [Geodermatophilus sp. SYSU D00691]
MRALQLTKWQSDAELRDVPEPEAGPGQVVIKVGGAGACHSDLHVMHDYPEGAVPFEIPFTLGHENAGWVHQVGPGVRGLEVGQPVAVYGPWGCGRCARCSAGVEIYCEDPANAVQVNGGGGLGKDGGFAPYMLVPDTRFLTPLPDGLEPVQAAPLTDAALTPYHAVKRSLPKLLPGSHAVVIGVGGLGHLGVQILKALSATTVIAVDLKENALELARSCGADVTIRSGEDAAAQIKEATGGRGADLVLDFVTAEPTLALAQQVVRTLGDLTIVGAGAATLPVGFYTQPYEVSVQAPCWGSRPELAEVMQMAARGLITPEITTFGLDDAMDAYRQMQDGSLRGRAVIVPNER